MAIDLEKVKAEITEAAERMGMDFEDLAEMVPDVLDDCKAKIAGLKTAIEAGDGAQVKAIAHDLKGSTLNYGIVEPSQYAKSLEANFESPDMADCEKFSSLIDELSELDLL
ncbi:MAG: Hpt domain-containing protein [SAR324 cluster bacterium]|nr:Hpt domain-containing protein [SAR324 cluster bacterium]